MKKFILISSVAAALLFAVSCTHQTQPDGSHALSAKVESTDLFSISYSIDCAPTVSYYTKVYRASVFSTIQVDDIVASLARRVEEGERWADLLSFGPQTITASDLSYGTDYKILLFELRGDGTTGGEPIVLDAKTDSFEAELEVCDLDYFGFTVKVSPNSEDIAWVSFCFPYDDFYSTQKGLSMKVQSILVNYDYADVAVMGNGLDPVACNPGEDALYCVVGVDEELNQISDVFSRRVAVPKDGFPKLAESHSDAGWVCLYNGSNIGIGFMAEVTSDATDIFSILYFDINGSSLEEHGLDFNAVSDDEIADFAVRSASRRYNDYLNDPTQADRLAMLSPLERLSELYYSAAAQKAEVGTYWLPVTPEALQSLLGAAPFERAAFAQVFFQIDGNGVISKVPGGTAVARYSVK